MEDFMVKIEFDKDKLAEFLFKYSRMKHLERRAPTRAKELMRVYSNYFTEADLLSEVNMSILSVCKSMEMICKTKEYISEDDYFEHACALLHLRYIQRIFLMIRDVKTEKRSDSSNDKTVYLDSFSGEKAYRKDLYEHKFLTDEEVSDKYSEKELICLDLISDYLHSRANRTSPIKLRGERYNKADVNQEILTNIPSCVDDEETFKRFGHRYLELTHGSHKFVVVRCSVTGEMHEVKKMNLIRSDFGKTGIYTSPQASSIKNAAKGRDAHALVPEALRNELLGIMAGK